jgi:trehalose/maltose hydrolase-like predicted phosphorylase
VSIAARGLQGQDYWGSIFWDYEIYVLPFLTYTQPEYARRSLIYRHHTLDGARRKAHSLGFQGAYYAWQSQETGDETCALYVFDDPRTGQKIRSYFADEQIHISADIAYALWQYMMASGDWRFMADYGLEILCEVARFFASRVIYDAAAGRYEIHTVLGPDEYHERVDNNALYQCAGPLQPGDRAGRLAAGGGPHQNWTDRRRDRHLEGHIRQTVCSCARD